VTNYAVVLCSDCGVEPITLKPQYGKAKDWDNMMMCPTCAEKRAVEIRKNWANMKDERIPLKRDTAWTDAIFVFRSLLLSLQVRDWSYVRNAAKNVYERRIAYRSLRLLERRVRNP
jgi:hypothetical protein